jgi:Icc-related predicted phosphoesterase
MIHQTPKNLIESCDDDESIREIIEASNPTLVFCGHLHWKNPLIELSNGSQVLNVDSRVVILINSIHDNLLYSLPAPVSNF